MLQPPVQINPFTARSGSISQTSLTKAEMTAQEFLNRPQHEILFELDRGAKLVIYQYVVSLVVITFRRNSPLQLVPADSSAAAKSLPWTLLSLVLGWWGIPFGLIYTPMVLYKNLNGGTDVTPAVLAKLRPAAPLSFQTAQ